MNLAALAKITERLAELAENHRELLLENAELNHFLRETEAQKAEELARFAHEMKKPLAVIRGLISRGDAKSSSKTTEPTGKEIDAEISRAAKLLDGMIALAQLEMRPKENEKFSLSKIWA